jgi:hypothetical protein
MRISGPQAHRCAKNDYDYDLRGEAVSECQSASRGMLTSLETCQDLTLIESNKAMQPGTNNSKETPPSLNKSTDLMLIGMGIFDDAYPGCGCSDGIARSHKYLAWIYHLLLDGMGSWSGDHRGVCVTRDESGTDIIRPTDRPKGSDTHMVRSYSNPDI